MDLYPHRPGESVALRHGLPARSKGERCPDALAHDSEARPDTRTSTWRTSSGALNGTSSPPVVALESSRAGTGAIERARAI